MNQSPDWQLISSVVERWRGGEPADAQRVLRENPHLLDSKSTFIELAYEEYLYRTEAGEEIDTGSFCERFPEYRYSIGRRLEAHLLRSLFCGVDFDDEEIAWPELGDEVCGFHLLDELGRGMVGRVFLAEELSLDRRKVVVKFTHVGVGEAETLSRLMHPNIVPVYSLQQDELSGLAIICMPYLGRHTLQDVLDAAFAKDTAAPLIDALMARFAPNRPAGQAVSYVEWIVSLGVSLCQALTHTHERGILHLDLKPSNILLAADGRPLVLDFNLSQDSDARLRLLGGTMPYMSPQQIQKLILGDIGIDLDARTDVFSLGVILYQLLTGVHPFSSVNLRQKPQQVAADLIALQTAGPILANKRNPRVSARLARLLQRAMSPQVDARPATATEFGALLQKELGGWKALRRTLRKHWRKVAAATAMTLALSAGVSGYYVTRDPPAVAAFNQGIAAANQGDYEDAVVHFTYVIDLDPSNHEAWFQRGRARQHLAQFKSAYDDFRDAWRLSPEQGRNAACAGFSAAAYNDNNIAVARYNQAIAEGMNTREVLLNKGRSLVRLRRPDEAEAAFLKAIKIDPSYSLAWHNLAMLYFNKRDLPKAKESIGKALQGQPKYAEMFAFACTIQWVDDSSRMDLIRAYLTEGLEFGLNERDCQGMPYLTQLAPSDSLRQKISSQPTRLATPLGPDPLDDAQIARRALGGR